MPLSPNVFFQMYILWKCVEEIIKYKKEPQPQPQVWRLADWPRWLGRTGGWCGPCPTRL